MLSAQPKSQVYAFKTLLHKECTNIISNHSHLMEFVEEQRWLDKSQIGFRKQRGTEIALVSATDRIRRLVDEGKVRRWSFWTCPWLLITSPHRCWLSTSNTSALQNRLWTSCLPSSVIALREYYSINSTLMFSPCPVGSCRAHLWVLCFLTCMCLHLLPHHPCLTSATSSQHITLMIFQSASITSSPRILIYE